MIAGLLEDSIQSRVSTCVQYLVTQAQLQDLCFRLVSCLSGPAFQRSLCQKWVDRCSLPLLQPLRDLKALYGNESLLELAGSMFRIGIQLCFRVNFIGVQ